MPAPTLRPGQIVKGKLSTTLKSWLPILQSSVLDIEETIHSYVVDNPLLDVKSGITSSFSSCPIWKKSSTKLNKGSIMDRLDSIACYQKSLYVALAEQITPPLFPTLMSQEIAKDIIENINGDGYFEGDTFICARRIGVGQEEYERIRQRFCYLEPHGVGARNMQEALSFHLYACEDISDELYEICREVIQNIQDHMSFKKHPLYHEALTLIKSFQIPPALSYQEEDSLIIPDLFITRDDGGIHVSLNEDYYPQVSIQEENIKHDPTYLKKKLKEARDLIDALDMRKQTLRKIGLMIIEYQYDFFMGGAIKPMRLRDLAEELNYSPSTISRAIANKYLECNQGIFPIKNFFTTAIDGETSNASIKNFILDLIKTESRIKPLSDLKILDLIEDAFEIKMVRRTITKYRKQLNIPSSSDRKKNYALSVHRLGF